MAPRIFITSDTHFGHDRDFIYGPRGFSSVQESDEEIIKRWNETVAPEDIVYLLGDIMLNDNENGIKCLKQLNGNIKIIFGNHDTDRRIALYTQVAEESQGKIEVLGYATMLKYKKWQFYLSHHPTLTANSDDYEKTPRQHLVNLFGHTHQLELFYENNPYMYHVGLDSHGCYPVCIDTIIEDIKRRTSNTGAF